MPLCPQITNTPITVTLTADFTVTNVVPVLAANTEQLAATDANVAAAVATANAAAATAGTAQSTANTALANAATAYTTAINSLQPSAYAIQNPTTKQLTAIDATGLTVYSGASSTSGARVVLNSVGLAGFDSGGTATFSISASTGAAVFRGNITTGATITGGTMNIAGKTIIDSAGLLTGTDVTLTGTINATAGYFGTASNGFSINSTGMVGVGNGIISGGLIQTSATTAVKLVGSTNSLSFMNGGTYVGHILNLSSSGILTHLGATANSTAGASYPYQYLSSGALFMASNSTTSISLGSTIGYTASLHDFYGNLTTNGSSSITASGELYAAGHQTTGNTAQGYVFTTGGRIARSTASSERYKENIVDLRDVSELDPRKMLNLRVRAFSYKENYLKNDDRTGVLIPGLIAEEVDAIYPLAVDYADGQIENINDRAILINLLALVQDLYKEIDTLKGA
jgi:trimeric autotransporter adhesin